METALLARTPNVKNGNLSYTPLVTVQNIYVAFNFFYKKLKYGYTIMMLLYSLKIQFFSPIRPPKSTFFVFSFSTLF